MLEREHRALDRWWRIETWLTPSGAPGQIAVLVLVVSVCGLAFLLLHVSTLRIVVVVCALGLLIFSILYPRAAICILVFSFFFGQEDASITIAQSLGVLTLSVSMLWTLANKRAIKFGAVFPLLLLWMAWVLCSFFYTRQPALVVTSLRSLVVNIAIYLLIVNFFTNWSTIQRIIYTIYIALLINSLFSVQQWMENPDVSGFRATGVSLDPNALGSMCVAGVGISILSFWGSRSLKKKIVWVGLGGLLLFTVLLTASRTANLALIALAIFLLAFFPKRRVMILGVTIAFCLLLPFAPGSYKIRMENLGEDILRAIPGAAPGQQNIRGYLIESGLRMWRDHPIIGIGIGNFKLFSKTVGYNPGIDWGKNVAAHNAYIELLAESGAIGFTIYVSLLCIVCRNFGKILMSISDSEDRRRLIGAQAAIIMLVHLVMSMTIPVLNDHSWFLSMALSASLLLVDRSDTVQAKQDSVVTR